MSRHWIALDSLRTLGQGRPGGFGAAARRTLTDRTELALLPALLVACLLLPRGLPGGAAAQGVIIGAATALQAVGLILVHRAHRIVNFAQIQVGASAGLVFVELVRLKYFVLPAYLVCHPCVLRPDAVHTTFIAGVPLHGVIDPLADRINFVLSIAIALLFAAGVSALMYGLVVRRLQTAPRLVLTVATIAMALVVSQVGSLAVYFLSQLRLSDTQNQVQSFGLSVQLPFPDVDLRVGASHLHVPDLLTVGLALVAMTLLAIFLRRSAAGIAIRGAADDPDRAQTLGIEVGYVSSLVWIAAGMLSALVAIASLSASQLPPGDLGAGQMLLLLAVAVVAHFNRLVTAVFAAITLGVVDAGVIASYGSASLFSVLLVVITAGLLLIRHGQATKSEQSSARQWQAGREIRPVPDRLQSVGAVIAARRVVIVAGAVALIAFPWLADPATLVDGVAFAVLGLILFSLLVLTGWAGQISLGHMGLAATGAFATSVLATTYGWPMPLALVAGGLAGAVASLAIGLPALRLRGLHLAITTLGFAIVVTDVIVNPDYLGHFVPTNLDRPLLLGLDLNDDHVFFYLCVVLLGLVAAAVAGMRRSRTARVLIAIRDNAPAAQSFGIGLIGAQLGIFAISGFIAGVGGGLLAYAQHGLKALSYVPNESVNLFVVSIIGGLGSGAGPILGAIFLLVARNLPPPLGGTVGSGTLLLVLLLFAPGGLAQVLFSLRDAFLRQVALRHRIDVPSLLGRTAPRGAAKLAPPTPLDLPFQAPRYDLAGRAHAAEGIHV